MRDSKIRTFILAALGLQMKDFSGFKPNLVESAIDKVLAEMNAEYCGESGSPGYEVNNEYYRIGRQKVRVCVEDEMYLSIWGPKALIERIHDRIIEQLDQTPDPTEGP